MPKKTRLAAGFFQIRHDKSQSDSKLGLFETLAVVGIEEHLAQTDGLRRHFHQLVFLDPGRRADGSDAEVHPSAQDVPRCQRPQAFRKGQACCLIATCRDEFERTRLRAGFF